MTPITAIMAIALSLNLQAKNAACNDPNEAVWICDKAFELLDVGHSLEAQRDAAEVKLGACEDKLLVRTSSTVVVEKEEFSVPVTWLLIAGGVLLGSGIIIGHSL